MGLVGDDACWGPEGGVRVIGIREGVHVLNVFELVQLSPGVVIAWEAGGQGSVSVVGAWMLAGILGRGYMGWLSTMNNEVPAA